MNTSRPPASWALREAATQLRGDVPFRFTPAMRDALAKWLEATARLEDREHIEVFEAQMVAGVLVAGHADPKEPSE